MRCFGLTEGFFLRYQDSVKLVKAEQKIHTQLDNIIPFRRLAFTAIKRRRKLSAFTDSM